MSESPYIRRYRPGEETELFDIFLSAIHCVACRDYTAEQVAAWAPRDFDVGLWKAKMQEINPFVAQLHGELVGYADVQTSGYIDHFFVSGQHPRRGIGSRLMERIFGQAVSVGVPSLTSHVSLTAEPFFARFGFAVVQRRTHAIRGIVVPNALMRRDLR